MSFSEKDFGNDLCGSGEETDENENALRNDLPDIVNESVCIENEKKECQLRRGSRKRNLRHEKLAF